MLMIAEHVAIADFQGKSQRRNAGLACLARSICIGEISLLAWTTDNSLIVQRNSLLPSVILRRHRMHNQFVESFARACKTFTETRELPGFRELSDAVEITPDAKDWALCPNCGRRFALYSKDSWNGDRHLTCGKRLIIQRPPSAS
jgi:hypothetical protein